MSTILVISGLTYQVLDSGRGNERPGPRDIATVRYAAWTADGSVAASSPQTTLHLGRIATRLAEGIQLISLGGKVRLWMPAFEPGPRIYEVELLYFERTEPARTIPPHLVSPSRD